MYQVKSLPRSKGSIKGEKNREAKKQQESAELKAKKDHYASQDARTEEIIASSNVIAQKIDSGSERVTQSMEELSKRVDKIKLEIPKQDNSDIVLAINGFSEKTESLIADLSDNVSKIKLETQTIDLNPHTKAITKTIEDNVKGLQTAMNGLTEAVKTIKFEQEPPTVEWVFDVSRNDEGYIEQIHAVVPEYELDS